jgi:hypothetical protein
MIMGHGKTVIKSRFDEDNSGYYIHILYNPSEDKKTEPIKRIGTKLKYCFHCAITVLEFTSPVAVCK